MKISVENTIAAPVATVWRAYTTPTDIMKWNAASDDWHTTSSTVDLRPGGTFSSRMEAKDGSFGFDFAGTYKTIVDHSLIEYEFGDRQATIEFQEIENGTRIRVSFDPEETHTREMQQQGWQAILDNFKKHVESIA